MKKLYSYRETPKKLQNFPTSFGRPPKPQEETINFSLTRLEKNDPNDSAVLNTVDTIQTVARLVLPWKEREAVKAGWKVTKWLTGRK